MASTQEAKRRARELVSQIVKESGFVRESSLESMSQEVRREVEEALLTKDKKIGASVLTLAKNLYTSNARFVFELLQNADDNRYHTAIEAGQAPFVSFKVYHDRIVVDCNADGLTEPNLRAICDIGNSSKTGSQGYIGEKGIGFKSVFMAAWKVHVQSGHYSFNFVHRRGDSGMGMVKPVWDEPSEELPHQLTRITLFLHEYDDTAELEHQREKIRKQFRHLQAPLLLFLRKIRRISVFFYDEQERQEWGTAFTMRDAKDENRVILETSSGDAPDLTPERRVYHVTKHLATNLAKSENRILSEAEESSRSYATSEIVLAFPLTETSEPIIEPQKVFAFLPMGQMGFNFLIRADFVTRANREDIVTDSARNRGLVNGIADAFVKAVLQFCTHDALQYSWMRYLPRKGTYHWDTTWSPLVDQIKQLLQHEPVLRTRKGAILRCIKDLKFRHSCQNDRDGNPLFEDLYPELYLSDSYAEEDVTILRDVGLEGLSMDQSIALAKQDLARSSSRLKRPDMDNDWHSRVALLLSMPFESRWHDLITRVRALDLIPLVDGSWVTAANGDIFYPHVGAIPIPRDLGLRLLQPEAAKHANRKTLFRHLGIRSADVQNVRSLILRRYSRKGGYISFATSMEHLEFLYLTHSSENDGLNYGSRLLRVYDHVDTMVALDGSVLYLLDDQPYGAQRLLGVSGALVAGVSFVNSKYFEDCPEKPSSLDLTWLDWMHEYIGVKRHVQLLDRCARSLSAECKYIAEHRRQMFLGYLKQAWPREGNLVTAKQEALEALCQIQVPCQNGKNVPLSDAYLPLLGLRNVCQRFTGGDDFPFLELPARTSDMDLLSHWAFLASDLGVGFRDDLDFRLRLVSRIQESAKEPATRDMLRQVADLYLYIEASCMQSQESQTLRARTRNFFEEEGCIWIPYLQGESIEHTEWVTPSECLWNAPDNMISKKPLRALYQAIFTNTGINIDELGNFFQRTLGVPNVTYVHITQEIKTIKRLCKLAVNPGVIYQLYGILHQSAVDDDVADEIRAAFEKHELIWVDRQGSVGWHRPTDCVWSSMANIEGKIAINSQYGDFQEFFVAVLGVQLVDLRMVHDSLVDVSSKKPPAVERVKELLRAFSSFLASDDNPLTPSRMLKCPVFPVRSPNGNSTLCSAQAEFVIIDREGPLSIFRDQVKYLDFSLQDVCRLRPFIAWAGLESRYLSRCVEESTRVEGGIEKPITERTRDLKTKAYGLLRIAAKYNSPRFEADAQGLYNLLRNTVTVETEGISSRLTLTQDHETYEHEVGKSELHIEETENLLKVYVPRDEDEQDVCFRTTLPRRLVFWLMTCSGANAPNRIEESAITIVNTALNCRVSAISTILAKEGVPEVDIPDLSENFTAAAAWAEQPRQGASIASSPATPTRQGHSSALVARTTSTPRIISSPSEIEDYPTPLTDPESYSDEESTASMPVYSRPPPMLSRASQELAYQRLLEQVVRIARRAVFPDFKAASLTSEFESLSVGDDVSTGSVSVHYFSDWERRMKTGAAGELFVFELLFNLQPNLPEFDRASWQSSIRHFAKVHPEYADLPAFNGTETSDIVYNDASGVLTTLLIQKGYLSSAAWAGKTPRYYIEVKTTADHCSTPFFVSDGQYARMQYTTNGPSGTARQDEIYAIFRVFNLGKDSMGLKVHVDPEEQRRKGILRFRADKYTVSAATYDGMEFLCAAFNALSLPSPLDVPKR